MIKISKMADYAVVILTALARSDGAQLTASGITVRTGLPEPTVSKVLKILARGKLLDSTRGATGGYKLARRPEDISVSGIISVVDGPISLTACVDGNADGCDYLSKCPIRGRWDTVNNAVRGALDSVTLADMLGSQRCMANAQKESNEQYL